MSKELYFAVVRTSAVTKKDQKFICKYDKEYIENTREADGKPVGGKIQDIG